MTKKPRVILASLWAPMALFLIPAIGALGAMMDASSLSEDDAPRRAGAGILLLIPFAYPIVALLMAAAGYFLLWIGKLSLRNLLIGCGILSLGLGAMFGQASPFGVQDQLISFGIFGTVTMFSLSLGVLSWWYLAYLGRDKSVG